MKLPDFASDAGLNALRSAMRADLRDYVPPVPNQTLTPDEIERLASDGIEIPLDQVRVLNDGTHVYKGRRVIVYIRDVAEYGAKRRAGDLPKYHLAMCDTLAKMIDEGRYKKRYVVATRDDGLFSIHRIRNERVVKSQERLDVCQNCLHELTYGGFSRNMSGPTKRKSVQGFSAEAFFQQYGQSCVWAMPKFDSYNAPPNVYSAHFFRLAKAIKEQRGYRCEHPECNIDLSNPQDHRFLHAHHIDADKSDSHPSNIQLLCIRCHAGMFQHSHLRESPDYKRFLRRFANARESGSMGRGP
jgi:hypothetical protein